MVKRRLYLAKLLLFAAMLFAISDGLRAQCSGGTNAGSITPTIAWQTIPCIRGGEYYTFTANAGSFYTFSFCMGGGSAGFDTQITILDNNGAYAGGFADDECAPGDHLWYWFPSTTGTYRVLVSAFPCSTLNLCSTLAYKEELNPYGGPGLNCSNPWNIPSIPYSQGGLSSCYYGSDYTSADACNSSYMDGEDFVLRFSGNAGDCISIFTNNTFIYTGLFLLDGCPNVATTNCIGAHEASAGNPQLTNVTLPTTGTYYIVVAMEGTIGPGCTPFDITVTPCVAIGVGNTCANPFVIPSLPYTQVGFTTCNYGDDFSSADACGSLYMNGDDFVYTYNSPGNECIAIELSGTQPWTGFFVMDGCPNAVGTNCIAQRGEAGGNPKLRNINLVNPGTYYIVVSTYPSPQCTQFNIDIQPCPPPCMRNPNASDFCSAPTMVSLGLNDTVCGFSNMNFTPDVSTDLGNDFCGSIENNSWFAFVADSSQMTFFVEVSNCLSGFGVQGMVFSTSDCNNFTPVSNCWNPQIEADGVMQATGLTIGDTYYIMLDGYAGDDCEYQIFRLGTILPIEWLAFDVKAKEEKVHLNWTTALEVNNKGFFVQRGTRLLKGGRDDFRWETLGFVEPKGDEHSGASYTYVDQPGFSSHNWYYRVQQMDLNGASEFSTIREIAPIGPEQAKLVSLYPNPSKDVVNLEYYLPGKGAGSIAVYSLAGMLLKQQQFGGDHQGVFNTSIDVSTLPSGMYIYLLSLDGEVLKGKLEIQK